MPNSAAANCTRFPTCIRLNRAPTSFPWNSIRKRSDKSIALYRRIPMATRLRWLGHSCLILHHDGHQILIDPFLTGNPKAAAKAADIKADFILVSHGHGDHIGDTIDIASRTGATVIANYEIYEWLQNQGLKKVHGMQHGG